MGYKLQSSLDLLWCVERCVIILSDVAGITMCGTCLFWQSGTSGAMLYLSSQIKEALRVSSLELEFDLPVFPLIKSVYMSTNTFLSQVIYCKKIWWIIRVGSGALQTDFTLKFLGRQNRGKSDLNTTTYTVCVFFPLPIREGSDLLLKKRRLSILCCCFLRYIVSLQSDLVNTIGESAALGAAGVVVWERTEAKTEVRTYCTYMIHVFKVIWNFSFGSNPAFTVLTWKWNMCNCPTSGTAVNSLSLSLS